MERVVKNNHKLREKIIQLHEEGRRPSEIMMICDCSRTTVHYHINGKKKKKETSRNSVYMKEKRRRIKILRGGCCEICGYKKTLNALDFHHIDSSKKKYNISLLTSRPLTELIEELGKCIMVCAN